MSVAIRLSRAGRVHLPYYHIGVYNSRTRRDGRSVEQLGFYDPKSDKEPVRIDLERAKYWLSVGAKPSATVITILKQQGLKSEDWASKKEKKAPEAKKAQQAAAKKTAAKRATKAKARKNADTVSKTRKPRSASSKVRGENARKTAN